LSHVGLPALRVAAGMAVLLCAASASSQQNAPATSSAPRIVQPGAPGAPNKTLSSAAAIATETPRPPSKADVEFMQGMIMHHNQAVEMTEMLKTRTHDPAVRELGKKIDVSQTDEMRWMKQWLTDRGFPTDAMADMDMGSMPGMHMDMPLMPGMLTEAQMDTLRKSTGPQFDHLFLTGMIQHHTGALTMVKDLFANPGAGQDPQLFDFATDVDNTQQAEIDIMRHMLKDNLRPRGVFLALTLSTLVPALCSSRVLAQDMAGMDHAKPASATPNVTVYVNPRSGPDDPRIGLKGGLYDAATAMSGLELVMTTPKPAGFAPDVETIKASVPPPALRVPPARAPITAAPTPTSPSTPNTSSTATTTASISTTSRTPPRCRSSPPSSAPAARATSPSTATCCSCP
jgi:uncharacterized protein (DUF305 family)